MLRFRPFALFVSLSLLNMGGCLLDDDIDDFSFALPEKTFSFDTGAYEPPAQTEITCQPSPDSCAQLSADLQCGSGGTCEIVEPNEVPSIPCDASNDPCPSFGEEFSCNEAAGVCQVTIPFELVTTTNLSDEVPELETVGTSDFTTVKFNYIRMYVQENSLSIATPPVEFFVAPDTVGSLWVPGSDPLTMDPQVEKVGTVPSIDPGVSGHTKDVELTPGGEAALTDYCRTPDVPFNLFVYAEITLQGGDPLPQGALTLQVDAEATVGLN
jgi:hypothetical protein